MRILGSGPRSVAAGPSPRPGRQSHCASPRQARAASEYRGRPRPHAHAPPAGGTSTLVTEPSRTPAAEGNGHAAHRIARDRQGPARAWELKGGPDVGALAAVLDVRGPGMGGSASAGPAGRKGARRREAEVQHDGAMVRERRGGRRRGETGRARKGSAGSRPRARRGGARRLPINPSAGREPRAERNEQLHQVSSQAWGSQRATASRLRGAGPLSQAGNSVCVPPRIHDDGQAAPRAGGREPRAARWGTRVTTPSPSAAPVRRAAAQAAERERSRPAPRSSCLPRGR